MSDDCSTCFFSFVAPASAGPFEGKRCCNRAAPVATNNANFLRLPNPGTIPNPWIWPVVEDDFWCGEGAQALDQAAPGKSFASAVNQLPTPQAYSSAAWNSFTSTLGAGSGSLASAFGEFQYSILGKLIAFSFTIDITTNGSAAGYLTATLPVAAVGQVSSANGMGYDGVSAYFGLISEIQDSLLTIRKYDGSYPGGDIHVLEIAGTYQSA